MDLLEVILKSMDPIMDLAYHVKNVEDSSGMIKILFKEKWVGRLAEIHGT